MNRPTPEFLASLTKGQSITVDNGSAGTVVGRIAGITPKLFIVRIGKERRRFRRDDGGTFAAPTASRSWLLPMEARHA